MEFLVAFIMVLSIALVHSHLNLKPYSTIRGNHINFIMFVLLILQVMIVIL